MIYGGLLSELTVPCNAQRNRNDDRADRNQPENSA